MGTKDARNNTWEIIARYYESPVAKPFPLPIELGTSVAEVINSMDLAPDLKNNISFYLDGDELPSDFIFEKNADVVVGLKQGKKYVAPLIMIAVAIAAPYVAPAILAAGGASAAFLATTAGTIAVSAVAAGITMVASLAVNALIPPPSINSGSLSDSSKEGRADDFYFVTGASNQPRLFEAVPSMYGKHKFFPDLAATPRVNTVGTKSEINMLFDAGLGDVKIEDINP